MKSARSLIYVFLFSALISCSSEPETKPLPDLSHEDLSMLYGFNLLENFINDGEEMPYVENDLRLIAENGFNFVRLPLDYRCLTVPGDWGTLDDEAMKVIDQVIEWGEKYGIHVCINLHHAPGFCINYPNYYSADSSLWTGEAAQEAFYSLWSQMALRYKGISKRQLSFNLLNEPVRTSRENYVRIAINAVEAIYSVDPERLIMSDGWNVGSDPMPELVPYKVVQMMRGYWPMSITHCGANWVNNTYGPKPEWPSNTFLGNKLQGPGYGEGQVLFLLKHVFSERTVVEVEILEVEGPATLLVRADENVLYSHAYNPEKDEVQHRTGEYRAAYMHTFRVTVPAGAESLSIGVSKGDWITYGRVSVFIDGPDESPVEIIPGNIWGTVPTPVVIKEDRTFVTENNLNPNWDSIYYNEKIKPWIDFQNEYNIGVMVGEWGVFNEAPYEVTLEWMEYMLDTWKENNLGWAMWNFRGSFGVADSNREGAEYTNVNGVQMDMRMMEMLKEYVRP